LPVNSRLGLFHYFNCVERVPGLVDDEKTKVYTTPELTMPPPLIVPQGHLYFLPSASPLPPIFRLREVPWYGLHVSDEFRQRVEASHLKGFEFVERTPGVGWSG
jgi:hypothetical protein